MKDAPVDKKIKKILFPVGERELASTDFKILRYAEKLTENGYAVDIVTHQEELVEKIKEKYKGVTGISVSLLKHEERFWTMIQRDGFAKTFIKFTHDIVVEGTDFKFWKQTGFDDFLWNVSTNVFEKITKKYDLVLLPIFSVEESPSNLCDVFYTHSVYYAKENRIPVAGLQIHPVYELPPICTRIVDFFIVKRLFEKEFFIDQGIGADKIFIVDALKDNYAIDTVEDPYKNFLFDSSITVKKGSFGILVVNHFKNRNQLYDIIDTVFNLQMNKTLFFALRNYTVRDLHENDIFKALVKPFIEQRFRQFYIVDPGGLIKALMHCDVIIATNYIVPLSFARKYDKLGVVYNPLKAGIRHINDVVFTDTKEDLQRTIMEQHAISRKKQDIVDIVNTIAEKV